MKNSYEVYWNGVKKELEGFHSQADYQMFINRVEFMDFDPNKPLMKLSVPSNFIKDHIIKYKEEFENSLTKIYGSPCSIEFHVVSTKHHSETEKMQKKNEPQPITNNKLAENTVNKADDYSFESFIIGNSNDFAAKAALAVAENPGVQYNPYFVWGESGLGKTHLLKAIEKYTKEHFPSKKVKYITSEEFTNDFVNLLSIKKMEQFRIKYRNLDVLILDDVQFFAEKPGLQEEIFNTFNKLYDGCKQMVFSCDQHISKVKHMEQRLKSRFSMGLVVDLRPPDFELRMAILRNVAETNKIEIDFNALEYICSNISGSIRDLKGAFQVLLAYYSLMKKKITLDIAKEKLKDVLSSQLHSAPVSVDKIIQFVAEYYNLKSHEIIGTKRTKSIAMARQVAMYISRKITMLSTTQIGKYFGDKEHATVMHATKKIEDYLTEDTNLKRDIDLLINRLKNE
jgi:chromosomal replication initiator protein